MSDKDKKFKRKAMVKLCVWTDEDVGPMNMDEQMKIVEKAIKERRFYHESINPPKND